MIDDRGYDAKKLYGYIKKTLKIDLICPIERYKSTSKERLELVCFYQRHWNRKSIAEGEEYR